MQEKAERAAHGGSGAQRVDYRRLADLYVEYLKNLPSKSDAADSAAAATTGGLAPRWAEEERKEERGGLHLGSGSGGTGSGGGGFFGGSLAAGGRLPCRAICQSRRSPHAARRPQRRGSGGGGRRGGRACAVAIPDPQIPLIGRSGADDAQYGSCRTPEPGSALVSVDLHTRRERVTDRPFQVQVQVPRSRFRCVPRAVAFLSPLQIAEMDDTTRTEFARAARRLDITKTRLSERGER